MTTNEVEKARQAQRAYARKWRAKNPEKVRANNLRYWARRADREAAGGKSQEAQNEQNED